MQKNKFDILVLKTNILFFGEKPPNQIFSLCFGLDIALKTMDAQYIFWVGIFENALKKLLAVKNAILAVFGS